jgi:hypothetical protein
MTLAVELMGNHMLQLAEDEDFYTLGMEEKAKRKMQ